MQSTQSFDISWHKEIVKLDLPTTSTILELKLAIEQKTNVSFESQKLLGLTKGKLPPDEVCNVRC